MRLTPLFFLLLLTLGSLEARSQDAATTVPVLKWEFRNAEESIWKPASVPGCIHTDLFANGIIPDPFYGTNEHDIQWIDSCDWEYRSILIADPAILGHEHVTLVFHGLDTYADVSINGQKVLHADNMFRRWEIPCKGLLKAGENEVVVHFYSVIKEARKLYAALPAPLPYDERVMVRKAPYQFGWDWGPRFVTMGLWKEVSLETWNDVKIGDFSYTILELTPDKAIVNFLCEIDATTASKYTLTLWQMGTLEKKLNISTVPGKNVYQIPVTIENPELWWPAGMGNPTLYDFSLICTKGNALCDEKTTRLGLRKIELVRENETAGQSFYFRVNGSPVFMKGANYIPSDAFPSHNRDQQINRLLTDAAKSNINMLRVWGGGIYEEDHFYDQCDALGILIWQDFMFACALYPGDSAYINNVKEEVTQQVTRLRNHPCIALWCGNNEIDEGWNNWGIQKQYGYSPADSARIWADYLNLFHKIIPEILKQSDPSRPYHASSPQYGWGRKESMTHGDSHYWGIWWGDEPFEVYNTKVPRFMSEYGFQGFPSNETIDDFAPEDQRYLISDVLKAHEKHPRGFELITNAMKRDYFVPDSLQDYAILSQFVQARAMQTAIEAHRRARPYCMGSLYWQFNDCWPVISWSGIDYNGQWKAAQYAVKRGFQTTILSTVITNDSVRIFGISDSLTDITGQLKTDIYNADGDLLWSVTKKVIIPEASATELISFHAETVAHDFDSTATFVYSAFSSGNKVLATSVKTFCKPGNYRQPAAVMTFQERVIDPTKSEITLVSDKPVMGVFLESTQKTTEVSDNYFDLMPQEPKKIIITFSNESHGQAKLLKFSYLSKLR